MEDCPVCEEYAHGKSSPCSVCPEVGLTRKEGPISMATTQHTLTTPAGAEFELRLKRLLALERQAEAALECRRLCHACGDETGTMLAVATYERTRTLIADAYRWLERRGFELFTYGGVPRLFAQYAGEGELAYDVRFTPDGKLVLEPSAQQYGIPLN
jgi:hypothetical protein